MAVLRKLASRVAAVIVATVAACSSPQAMLVGDDAVGGDDAGRDAANDAGADAGAEAGIDAGIDPDPDAGPPPDAPNPPEPGELAIMCGTTPTTTEAWEQCRVKRFCETHVNCSEQNLYASAQECIALLDTVTGGEIALDTFESARAVASGRAMVDVFEFTQCLRELSPERCGTAGTAAACLRRYTGVVEDGQQCFGDAECRSPGASCAQRDCGAACCAGICEPRARLGQGCHDFDACEPGLMCSTASQKCVSGDVGSTCARFDCDSGNWCNAGVCRPDLAEGVACDSLLQCGGETVCVGLRRPVETPRCRHATSVGDVCDWFCLGNLFCDLSSGPGLGTCRPLPHHDQPCSALVPCVGQNDRCSEQGLCVTRTAVGQPCSDGTCRPGLFCTDQLGSPTPVCRVLFADGESGCKQAAQCESHLCSGDQTTAGQCLAEQPTCP